MSESTQEHCSKTEWIMNGESRQELISEGLRSVFLHAHECLEHLEAENLYSSDEFHDMIYFIQDMAHAAEMKLIEKGISPVAMWYCVDGILRYIKSCDKLEFDFDYLWGALEVEVNAILTVITDSSMRWRKDNYDT